MLTGIYPCSGNARIKETIPLDTATPVGAFSIVAGPDVVATSSSSTLVVGVARNVGNRLAALQVLPLYDRPDATVVPADTICIARCRADRNRLSGVVNPSMEDFTHVIELELDKASPRIQVDDVGYVKGFDSLVFEAKYI